MSDKCFSVDGERYFDDITTVFESLDDDDLLVAGAEYHEADKVENPASACFDGSADRAIEDAINQAWDLAGEWAEDFADDVPQAAKDELEQFIKSWADRHINVYFFTIANDVKKQITQAGIDAYRASLQQRPADEVK